MKIRLFRNIINLSLIQLLIVISILSIVCNKKSSKVDKEILLAKIGEKSISVNEFIRRAEYTIRPPYCKEDNYIHKKIILNSLIAEKLFSLEAGNINKLMENKDFQDYLKGQKEQAMRQWMYNINFYEKVELDYKKLQQVYELSKKKYNIAYYSIKDSLVFAKVKEKFKKGLSFSEIYKECGGIGEPPIRVVTMNNNENEIIRKKLFSTPLEKGQVIGPVEIEENYHIYIKILDWTRNVLMTEHQQNEHLNNIKEILRKDEANSKYNVYVKRIMRGKKVTFNPEVFYKVVDILGPQYILHDNEKQKALKQKIWNSEDNNFLFYDKEDIKKIADIPFLKIENSEWSVKKLMEEIEIHPLVFRKRRIKNSEFAQQFKLAIVDMIRDKYITKEAYEKGYDKELVVKRNVNMWRDYLNAIFYRNQYLDSTGVRSEFFSNSSRIIKNTLNPLFNKLKNKYNEKIIINIDRFKDIKLSKIDMFVIQRDMPFPVVVPSFPIITDYNKLDYGSKMD